MFTNQVVYKIVLVKLQNVGFLHTKQKFFSSYSLFIVLLQAEEEVGVRFSTIPRLPATGILHTNCNAILAIIWICDALFNLQS